MALGSRLAALLCGAAALEGAGHLQPCSPGPVGGCRFLSCSKHRGPTECVNNQCMCLTGYCRYPASTLHVQARKCRAQVPDVSCGIFHPCVKGGVLASSCVNGMCLCRSHMHVGEDGQCHTGWWPEKALAGMNESLRADTLAFDEADEQARREEDYEVARNALGAAALVTLPLALVISGAMFLGRKLRAPRHGADTYKELPDGVIAGGPVVA